MQSKPPLRPNPLAPLAGCVASFGAPTSKPAASKPPASGLYTLELVDPKSPCRGRFLGYAPACGAPAAPRLQAAPAAWRVRAGTTTASLEAVRPRGCAAGLAAAPKCGAATRLSRGPRPTQWRFSPAPGVRGALALATANATGCAPRALAAASAAARCARSSITATAGAAPSAWRLARVAAPPPPPLPDVTTVETAKVGFSFAFSNLTVEDFGPPQRATFCDALLAAAPGGGGTCVVDAVYALPEARRRLAAAGGIGVNGARALHPPRGGAEPSPSRQPPTCAAAAPGSPQLLLPPLPPPPPPSAGTVTFMVTVTAPAGSGSSAGGSGAAAALAQVFVATLEDAAVVSAALAEEFPGATITVTSVEAAPATVEVVEGAFVPPAPGGEAPAPGGEAPAPSGETPAPSGETPAPSGETPANPTPTPEPTPEPAPVPAPVPLPVPVPTPTPSPAASPSPSPSSTPSPSPSPPNLPGAPTAVTAVASTTDPTKATVSWAAPAYAGASAITGYSVNCTAGAVTVGPQAFGDVVTTGADGFTDLLPATAYTCTVAAVNAAGAGVASVASAEFTTPNNEPGAPTAVTAVASTTDPTKATVSWAAPAYAGASAITGYSVNCTAGAVTVGPQAFGDVVTTGADGFTDLLLATVYTCTVAAVNAAGVGVASVASAAFTTLSATPGAPTGVVAAASLTDPARATVSWVAPAYAGTSAITGYSVSCTASGSGTVVGPLSYAADATTTGANAFYALAGATTYVCAVAATNTAGAGVAGAAADAITTLIPPGTLPLTASYAISSLAANTTFNNAWSTQNLGNGGAAALVVDAPVRNESLSAALWLTTACADSDRASAATAFGEAQTIVTNPAPALLLPAYTAGAFNGMPLATFLAQLDQISYSFYKKSTSGACTPNAPGAPSLKLELGSAEGGYTVLVWEPWAGVKFQTAANASTPGNGPLLDTWYFPSITAGRGNAAVGTTTPAVGCTAPNAGCATGGWWSTRNSPAPLERWASLAAWAAYWDNPASANAPVQTGTATKIVGYSSKAVIQKISLEVGTYNRLMSGYVGELRIKGATFDWTYNFG